ncbi:glucan endo-1,3-beta-glucosidase-like [Malania oleifera]|uniref:glucan endo-1,3-beta-glucosidase-like n=1 Tax=Malania oleifera TaxID=397392 RepID=UPI0025AE6286|nr:glucan endo-1,3-beta-glucosidase-like [Malania oleifera]
MAALLIFLALSIASQLRGAQSIGVCYGRLGDNLPAPPEVIELYKSNGIPQMRLYDPDPSVLQALKGSNIDLILGVPNQILQALASDPSAATQWVQTNVLAFSPDVKFKYIAVGNEIKPVEAEAASVLPAMQNVRAALVSAGLQDQIKVSTSIEASLLGVSDPPSASSFSDVAKPYIEPIISFLASTSSPLLANVYPYFGHIGHPQNVQLPFALFTAPGIVHDPNSNLDYQNLFDAMVDALYFALEKSGGANVGIVVSESGWPSAGGTAAATPENAETYYKNLIQHAGLGTPKRPGVLETYLFAMFDENQKTGAATEQHYGLFSPSKQPKYQISFN